MGKTFKERKGSKGLPKNKSKKSAHVEKPRKPPKEKGLVPASYAPRSLDAGGNKIPYKHARMGHELRELFNGVLDKELYRTEDGVEFTKQLYPMYKGAPVGHEIIFIEVSKIPKYHPLALAGVEVQTRIPFAKLKQPVFVAQIKDEVVYAMVEQLYKFLRIMIEGFGLTESIQYVTESKVTRTEISSYSQIEKESSAVARILWGDEDRVGLVGIKDVVFRIAKLVTGLPVIYVHKATEESGLVDAELHPNLYVSVVQLRSEKFESKLINPAAFAIQKQMWSFLRIIMEEEGIITAPTPQKKEEVVAMIPVEQKKNPIPYNAEEASEKMLELFLSAKPDLYKSKDEKGSNAFFSLDKDGELYFKGADNEHMLGHLQESGELSINVHFTFAKLKHEVLDITGMPTKMAEGAKVVHQYLRDVGMSLGIKAKKEVQKKSNASEDEKSSRGFTHRRNRFLGKMQHLIHQH